MLDQYFDHTTRAKWQTGRGPVFWLCLIAALAVAALAVYVLTRVL